MYIGISRGKIKEMKNPHAYLAATHTGVKFI
jgi:hypothetical protein